MASNELVILRVDASTTDGECLCTGENRAATKQRKSKASEKDGGEQRGPSASSSLADVSIVCVEAATPRKKKRRIKSSKTNDDFPAISLLNSDEEDEPMEVDSAASSAASRPSTSSSSSSTSKELGGAGHPGNHKKNKAAILRDEVLAKSLQEREYRRLDRASKDVSIVMESGVSINKPGTSSSLSSYSPSPSRSTVTDHVQQTSSPSISSNSSAQKVNPLHRKHPTCWTECPNCPPDANRKYHLIAISKSGGEWDVVARPVVEAGFTVATVRRIQNEMIWQRLCFEKQLMLRERPDVNEKFLYHSSRAETSVICEEGLDQRVSRSNGCFGSGIYFSDNPIKCDRYSYSTHGSKTMFCCRVLMGHTKIYPNGVDDRQLVREPVKEYSLPGESKTYDSVQGNITGQNEFVVYNNYRVMPEYIIEYHSTSNLHSTHDPFNKLLKLSMQSYKLHNAMMKHKRRKRKKKPH